MLRIARLPPATILPQRRLLASVASARMPLSFQGSKDTRSRLNWGRDLSYDPERLTPTRKELQRFQELLRQKTSLEEGGRAAFSPSFFTGRPLLHDTLYQLDRLLKIHAGLLQQVEESEELRTLAIKSQPAWIAHGVLQEAWNFRVPHADYQRMVQQLAKLHWVATAMEVNAPLSTEDPPAMDKDRKAVQELINQFKKPGSGGLRVRSNPQLDEWGRAYAAGFRRRIKAHVWLVEAREPGTGRVMIDGLDMTDCLPRLRDRATLLAPFEVTDTMGKFHVWCELEKARPDINGGGTGVAGAVANGIANALVLHHPGYEKWLAQANLMVADLRQHERKKPGQPGARAKFQWVKR